MGRVNFCNGSQWGTICIDGWDHFDAAVVCRELGYAADGKSGPYNNNIIIPIFTLSLVLANNNYHALQVHNRSITLTKIILL